MFRSEVLFLFGEGTLIDHRCMFFDKTNRPSISEIQHNE